MNLHYFHFDILCDHEEYIFLKCKKTQIIYCFYMQYLYFHIFHYELLPLSSTINQIKVNSLDFFK